jgi:DNA repair exonuclease SbcCD ATPase subunit
MGNSSVDALDRAVRASRRSLDQAVGEARAVASQIRMTEAEIADLGRESAVLERVALLLTSLGEERQNTAQVQIEQLVTRGLQTIFDETLSFHLVQSTRASAAQVDFLVRTTLPGGQVIETPVMDARGGGVAATVGFLLRLVVLLLRSGTSKENVLLLDETFAMVSSEYLERLGEFLRLVVDKTGVQIVLVTHQPVFGEYADRVYRFSMEDGTTVVRSS